MKPALSRRDFLRGRLHARALFKPLSHAELEASPRDADRAPFQKVRAAEAPPSRVFAIAAERCLGSASQVCTVCKEHCPEPAAIGFVGLVATINQAACTGCGECVRVCPAPILAISMTEQKVKP